MRALALALLLMLLPGVAHADATPSQVVLLYMPNVSTTGTPAASGIAELVLQEGEVRISVTDLPRLDGDRRYVAWVIDTDANAFLRLGAFNTAQSTAAAHFETVLPDPIPTAHWNLVLLTVEDGPTPDRPSARHSIAGMFPPSGSDLVPELLPNTGGADPDDLPIPSRQADWLPSLGLATLALCIGFGTGYRCGKRIK